MTASATPEQLERLRELRAALTPAVRELFQDLAQPALSDLFALLRRLQPGDVTTAMLCHRALLRQAGRELREAGYITAELADLTRLVFNVLEGEGYRLHRGRWAPRGGGAR
jgi:hypothetical protein